MKLDDIIKKEVDKVAFKDAIDLKWFARTIAEKTIDEIVPDKVIKAPDVMSRIIIENFIDHLNKKVKEFLK